MLNTYLTVINDIVHPAHKLSYKYFVRYEPMINWYAQNQQIAFEKKLVPPCYALCCDPDGIKTKARVQELEEKAQAYEQQKAEQKSDDK